MYKILVVDDEPAGLKHVCTILGKKCPQFEIQGTAENGEKALEQMRISRPDILITDIKMPVMDGIQLIYAMKKEFPEVLSVIVSGYSDFDYARNAIKAGACDYLLKPLVPSEMQQRLEIFEKRLNERYYIRRMEILRSLCHGKKLDDPWEMTRYFESGGYYAVLFRQNGLPRRFSKRSGIEIFSMEEEKIYIYGRDEMESLYLIPRKYLLGESFVKIARHLYQKEKNQKKGNYLTGVAYDKEFCLEDLPHVFERLYNKLNEAIVVGEDRLLFNTEREIEHSGKDEKEIQFVEYLIRCGEESKLQDALKNLFSIWRKEKSSQMHVESELKFLYHMAWNKFSAKKDFLEIEHSIDDMFYYASNMEEVEEGSMELLRQCVPRETSAEQGNKEALFTSILSYMSDHVGQQMYLGDICRRFGVSQTSLSRMFRTYAGVSFSNYLTHLRIEKAKHLMSSNPDCYIRVIAEACGYNDQFYFSRIFRSVTGMCPKDFIEKQGVMQDRETGGM